MEKPCILVSACLLGMNCRYNGKGELNRQVLELFRDAALIPFARKYTEVLLRRGIRQSGRENGL